MYYSSSTYIHSVKLLALCCDCTVWFMSDLVRNPNCWFSQAQAQFTFLFTFTEFRKVNIGQELAEEMFRRPKRKVRYYALVICNHGPTVNFDLCPANPAKTPWSSKPC